MKKSRREQLTETERVSIWFGMAVAQRYKQRAKEFPPDEWTQEGIIALAASDVWIVLTESNNPMKALEEYLELEDSFTGGGG